MIRILISSASLLLCVLLLTPTPGQAAGHAGTTFTVAVHGDSAYPVAHREGDRREVARDHYRDRDGCRHQEERHDRRRDHRDWRNDRRQDARQDRHRAAPPRYAYREQRTVVLLPPPFLLLPPFWR
ncbi:hypothetical protein JCM30471_27260 [Desulfuromonas carbonis]|uniref:hypothetical protein n=1 Tax=Desulfuromonas sp. DDH964 TaxID=1823759 RepID=UPI00078DFF4A|nr:hypothetical protein [Desulfuromonas sp. DDH964]AMV70919.1 hypothetical protein DBW_0518 [Desulfuromonas sp. DDH964]